MFQGFILDVNVKGYFGFISAVNLECDSTTPDKVFFHLSDFVAPEGGVVPEPASVPSAPAAKGGKFQSGGLWVPNGSPVAVGVKKGDEVQFNVEEKKGKIVGVRVELLTAGTIKVEKSVHDLSNCCKGIVLLEPSYTTVAHTPNHGTSLAAFQTSGAQTGLKTEGRILLTKDPSGYFGTPPINLAFTANSQARENKGQPLKRGEVVTFLKGKSEKIKDVRFLEKGSGAKTVKGNVKDIDLAGGVCKFGDSGVTLGLDELCSCEPSVLKEGDEVECIEWNGRLFGASRTKDLYLAMSVGGGAERKKLNLNVKSEMKGQGGLIVAQSYMAKGPGSNGAVGFISGWTQRVSSYDQGGGVDDRGEAGEAVDMGHGGGDEEKEKKKKEKKEKRVKEVKEVKEEEGMGGAADEAVEEVVAEVKELKLNSRRF